MSKPQENKNESKKPVDFSTLDIVNLTFNRPAKWYMYVVKQVLKTKDKKKYILEQDLLPLHKLLELLKL
jgi:hypothetical protein